MLWPRFCGCLQPSSGKSNVPEMCFVDTSELCVLWWVRMGETVKEPASLEVPEPQGGQAPPWVNGAGDVGRDPTTGSSQNVFTVETPGWRGVGGGGSVFLKGQGRAELLA